MKPKKLMLLKRRLLLSIIFLSLLGAVISGYLVKVHYSDKSSPCDLSNSLSCSIVNKSQYAEILGISVAVLGVIFYSALGAVSFGLFRAIRKEEISREINRNSLIYFINSPKLFLLMALPALIFSLYLTYAEFFLIGSACVLCLFSQGTILGITAVGYKYHQLYSQPDHQPAGEALNSRGEI